MKLICLNYSEFLGEPREWKFEGLRLRETNLIVGKNATGKSRIISIISSLAKLLSGNVKVVFVDGNFDVTFEHGGTRMRYLLEHRNFQVIREEFIVDGKQVLRRGQGGYGWIAYDELDGKELKFQTPAGQLAVVTRQDKAQHKFLEPLHEWGESVRYFEFGSAMGRPNVIIGVPVPMPEIDDRDTTLAAPIFHTGMKKFGDPFKQSILSDMKDVGYDLEDIELRKPTLLKVEGFVPGEILAIAVKERDSGAYVDQYVLSQGMFRALSIIIQLNYGEVAKRARCVLIDDIGEGLDFERSCKLIGLLRRKAAVSTVQLIMSTNDRFVMNAVPLEEWSMLQRIGGLVKVHNYENSKEVFDDFKFTGLSNFDFLASDFINEQEEELVAAHE